MARVFKGDVEVDSTISGETCEMEGESEVVISSKKDKKHGIQARGRKTTVDFPRDQNLATLIRDCAYYGYFHGKKPPLPTLY